MVKRFGLAALTVAALGLGWIDSRPASAQPGGYRPASEYVEVQYRRYHRDDRRAVRRAWQRERERRVARQAYRAGRRDGYYRGRY